MLHFIFWLLGEERIATQLQWSRLVIWISTAVALALQPETVGGWWLCPRWSQWRWRGVQRFMTCFGSVTDRT